MGETSKRPKKGAAKVRHLGRKKTQIARYYERVQPARKIRHLLHNNGEAVAKAWAMKHNAVAIFISILNKS